MLKNGGLRRSLGKYRSRFPQDIYEGDFPERGQAAQAEKKPSRTPFREAREKGISSIGSEIRPQAPSSPEFPRSQRSFSEDTASIFREKIPD